MWHFLHSGFGSASVNMRTDEALALALSRGQGAPTVRLYGWEPWAISVGWNQSLDDVLVDRATADGIDLVRRPTGGRAVLHARELTYAVVMPANGKSVSEIYRTISAGLVAGLRILGMPAAIEAGTATAGDVRRDARLAACFISTARYEIKVDGRKIIGSAQRRYPAFGGPEVVLQHGSLLLGNEHIRIAEYLHLPEAGREMLRKELVDKSTDVEAVLGRNPGFDEVAAAMKSGFQKAWSVRFDSVPGPEVLEKEIQ